MFDHPVTVRQLRQARLLEADQSRFPVIGDHAAWPRRRRRRRFGRRSTSANPLDRSLELFAGLDRRALDRLARHFEVIDLAPGASLGRQGEPASMFVVVLTGRIGVTLDGLPLTVLDAGAQFGALPLLDGGPGRFSRASFDVLEPSRVAIANRRGFFEIVDRFPAVRRRIVRIADIRRAYLEGHADASALAADRATNPFPVHLT